MVEIVNLRQARKRKERAEREALAADNRMAFGRSKAEGTLSEARQDLAERRLQGHRRDDASGSSGTAADQAHEGLETDDEP